MTAVHRLLYAFDPLCGWCYGFAPVLDAVRAAHPDVPVDIRMGGLVTGDRIGPYNVMRDYIEGASANMAEATGRKLERAFFDNLLGDTDIRSSSVEPCIVVAHVRDELADSDPDRLFAFTAALQDAHFQQGADYNDPSTYRTLFDDLSLELEVPDLDDPALHKAVDAEFIATRALGVNSYPTVLAVGDHNRLRPLPISYDPDQFIAKMKLPAENLRYAMPADGI